MGTWVTEDYDTTTFVTAGHDTNTCIGRYPEAVTRDVFPSLGNRGL